MNASTSNARYRWLVAARVLIAALGGYVFASVVSIWLALLWPVPLAKAVLASTMLSFLWYAIAVMWVFSVRSVTRAWVGLLVPTLLLGAWCLWLLPAVPAGGAQ